MTTPPNLSTLETDLAVLATPTSPLAPGGRTANVPADSPLTAVNTLFRGLEQTGIGTAVGKLADGINSGLDDAADALDKIATQLQNLPSSAEGDVATTLTTLQSALATAGGLVPGSANVAALQSGSQFFQQLGSLLTDLGSASAAVAVLYQIAQQLRAIAALPT